MSLSVVAIVVTYNRCALLKRCIHYLHLQKDPLDEIVVINNGSTDNTYEVLQNMNVQIINQENLGSAGGWNRGLQYALNNKFDAAWLMDDDGYPDSHALYHLKKALKGEVACASSIVVRENNPESFVFPFPVLNKDLMPATWVYPRKIRNVNDLKKYSINNSYPYAHLFNGALISMNAVKNIGNVNTNYFMYGDEVDYFMRLKRAGKVVSLLKSNHYHPDVSKRSISSTRIYYYLKNTLIINSLYYKNPLPRHIIMIIVVLANILNRNGLRSLIYILLGRKDNCLYLAISRGLRGKIGKDYDG